MVGQRFGVNIPAKGRGEKHPEVVKGKGGMEEEEWGMRMRSR